MNGGVRTRGDTAFCYRTLLRIEGHLEGNVILNHKPPNLGKTAAKAGSLSYGGAPVTIHSSRGKALEKFDHVKSQCYKKRVT